MGRKKPGRKAEPPSRRGIAWPRWTGFRGMTVRDWLQLLIVPFALVVIGFLFTMQQDARQQAIVDQRAQQAQKIEEQRADDVALQTYFDQMSTLLLQRDLRLSTEDDATEDSKEARILARARTLTVLSRLDPSRKTEVMQFLVEAELVQGEEERAPIINLSGAHLHGADLFGANLSKAELGGANLSEANLSEANLSEANLGGANLSAASLSGADLSGTFLSNADLSDAIGVSNEQLQQ